MQNFVSSLVVALCGVAFLPTPASAQVPNTLMHSIPAPPVGAQCCAQLGTSVAVDGGVMVVGAPLDSLVGGSAGMVRVFNSATGALLYLLPNPTPAAGDQFGRSVAISGTRVVVGAPYDNTGASGAGSAYVYDLGSGTPTVPVATFNNPTPGVQDLFGWSIAISGTRVVVGAFWDDTGASDAGSAYVYDLAGATPALPVATLNNPGPASGEWFGRSVAISGTRVVVGAPYDNTGASGAGSAYVYDLGSGTPTVPVATLNNPGPASQDNFGWSVAISGTRVVVGARFDDTGAGDAGSAYLYDLASATPAAPAATLNNPSPAAQDYFGYSVAISGTRVVVGAYGDDTGAGDAGSAYVYELSSGTPTVPVTTFNNPTPAAFDDFGYSVAISGTRLVVGAPYDDTGAGDAGSAYMYDLSNVLPTVPVATLNNPSPAAGDDFGTAVAISGTRVVIGAPYDNTGAGSAYMYDLSSATPTVPVLTLNNPTPAVQDFFGTSVAISGTRVVVGALYDDTGAADAGSAYVYDLSSGSPTVPMAALNNPTPAANDQFGTSVAISGTRVVVGAPYDNTGASAAGSAYVYDLSSGTPTVPIATLNNPTPAAGDTFGTSVAISGTRVVVGALRDDTVGFDAGSVYVYDIASGTPTVPVATLNSPGPNGGDNFGWSVAISGTRVVVGEPFDNTGASRAGSAYVYDIASGTPTVPVATLNNPSPAASDYFGRSVAISGTRVVVGAYYDDTGASDAGSAYVYDLSSGMPAVPVATLTNPTPAADDWFGYSVAIDGTTAAIGTPYDDSVAMDKGYAYVFGPFAPEIVVEIQPASSNIADGGSHDIGGTVPGSSKNATFTIKNIGFSNLILNGSPKVTVSGTHAGMFTVTMQPVSPVSAAGGSTTFTVQFLPTGGGVKMAALSIPNNDIDEAPFRIYLTGTALSFTTDTDGDGMSDASEANMAALGFDWQVAQPALVNNYYANANGAGLYTTSQVQALNVGVPVLTKDTGTGKFKLTIGVKKTTNLTQPFLDFPMNGAGFTTVINAAGKLEFQFTVPDNAAFFRVQSQ